MAARSASSPISASDGMHTDKQVATAIAQGCAELRHTAKRPRFRTLSYLLDMARIEAERMARELPD